MRCTEIAISLDARASRAGGIDRGAKLTNIPHSAQASEAL